MLLAGAAFAVALASNAVAQQGGATVMSEPGKVGVVQTVAVTAVIKAVDAATRTVTLVGPQGGEMQVTAGDEVKNFAQLQPGQRVDVKYAEALVVELIKGGGAPVTRSMDAGAAAAKPGEMPAALGARKVTVVGDVIALDPANQKVTVKGPQRTVNLKVNDPEQFKLIAMGDQLQATYTEAVAVDVSPAKQ
jgi:hypothetical protein